jgi:hypothetical protein
MPNDLQVTQPDRFQIAHRRRDGRGQPDPVMHDVEDRALRDAVLGSQAVLTDTPGAVPSADLRRLDHRQFGVAVPVASGKSLRAPTGGMRCTSGPGSPVEPGRAAVTTGLTPFRHHVRRVLGRSAQEQVLGPNAGRLVAGMAHEQPRWNRAVHDIPDVARGRRRPKAVPKLAVAPPVPSGGPQPASIGLENLRPEALEGWLMPMGDPAPKGATAPEALSDVACRRLKERAADDAGPRWQRSRLGRVGTHLEPPTFGLPRPRPSQAARGHLVALSVPVPQVRSRP